MKSPVTPSSLLAKVLYLASFFIAGIAMTANASANSVTLKALGADDNGTFGLTYDPISTVQDVALPSGVKVTKVAAGVRFTLYLGDNGVAYASGSNKFGQLGDGTGTDQATPVPVQFRVFDTTTQTYTAVAVTVTDIAAGAYHSVFLASNGDVYAAGLNSNGQLGNRAHNTENLPIATKVIYSSATATPANEAPIGMKVTKIAAGAYHTVILSDAKKAYAFGANTSGQLGKGYAPNLTPERTQDSSIPYQFESGDVTDIAASAAQTYYIKSDSTLWAAGYNNYGQLGDTTQTTRVTPVKILDAVKMVAPSFRSLIIVKTDDTIYAVGDNTYGQYGDGTNTSSLNLTKLSFKDTNSATVTVKAKSLGLGYYNTLIIADSTAKDLWVSGMNANTGILGKETDGTSKGTAIDKTTRYIFKSDVIAVAAGQYHLVYVTSDGKAHSSGEARYGQLGTGKRLWHSTPTDITPAKDGVKYSIKSVNAVSNRISLVTTDGYLLQAGGNVNSQLGVDFPDIMDGLVPTPTYTNVFTLPAKSVKTDTQEALDWSVTPNVESVALSPTHTHVIRTTSTGRELWECGLNDQGQLGNNEVGSNTVTGTTTTTNGTTTTTYTAVSNPLYRDKLFRFGGNPYKSALGTSHSLIVTPDGNLFATGANGYGQLGIPIITAEATSTTTATYASNSSGNVRKVERADDPAFGTNVVYVAAAGSVSAFIRSNGDLYVFGANSAGQLGTGDLKSTFYNVTTTNADNTTTTTPYWNTESLKPRATNVRSVHVTDTFVIYIKNDNTMWGMGYTKSGVIREPSTSSATDADYVKTAELIDTDVLTAAVGSNHLVYIKTDHSLWGKGSNFDAELGGDDNSTLVIVPRLIANNVVAVAAGYAFTTYLEESAETTQSLTVSTGASTVLAPALTTVGAATYQWSKDGVEIPMARGSTYTISDFSADKAGVYTLFVTKGGVVSVAARITVTAATTGTVAGAFSNFSVRGVAGYNDQPLILGLVAGSTAKDVLLRGVGPGLTGFGVTDALADPTLEVHANNSSTVAASNDNWGDDGAGPAMAELFAATGAFALADGSADAATVYALSGAASVFVKNADLGTKGTVLAEAYETDPTAGNHLKNLSVRNHLNGANDWLILGFNITGDLPKKVLIRGVGPGLTQFSVTDAISNPVLALHRADNTTIASNDDWSTEVGASAAFTASGAFALTAGSKDAAIVVTLPPGSYTAVLNDAAGGAGEALVEAYELP